MPFSYGCPPGAETGDVVGLARIEIPGGLTLTKISGGSYRVNDAASGDSVSSIKVGTQEILGATVTWATDDLTFTRLIVRQINSYTATSGYWATHDGVDKVLIWSANGASQDTGVITDTESGFTSVIQDMDVYQAFVAAVDWNSGNEGADAFADTGMYRIGFSMSHLYSLDNSWTLTSAKGAEVDFTTEDQTLSIYMSSRGVHTLGSAAVKKTLSCLGAAMGHISMFASSGAAQNAVYSLRVY